MRLFIAGATFALSGPESRRQAGRKNRRRHRQADAQLRSQPCKDIIHDACDDQTIRLFTVRLVRATASALRPAVAG